MPCGGIYPIKGTWVEPYFNSQCWQCDKLIAREDAVFCEEWDTFLHKGCIDEFLKTGEGKIVLQHGHEVIRE